MIERFNKWFIVSSILFAIIVLMIHTKPFHWEGFADPYDYLHQAKKPIGDVSFYFPPFEGHQGHYQRAFATPLFYKIAGGHPDVIINLQKILYISAVTLFAWVLSGYFKRTGVKVVVAILTFLWALQWQLVGWTIVLLSESISNSLFLFWVSSLLLLHEKTSFFRYAFHIVILILLVFTKDSWPFSLVAFYFLMSLMTLFLKRSWFKKALIGTAISSILLVISLYAASVGARHRIPLVNSIVLRVMPDSAHYDWFINKGMPQGEMLRATYLEKTLEKPTNIYALYIDPEFEEFHSWIVEKGKGVYIEFMLTHPGYFFLSNEQDRHLDAIVSFNYIDYIKEPRAVSKLVSPVFTYIGGLLEILMIPMFFVLLLLIYLGKPDLLIPLSIGIAICSLVFGFISYHGDAIEIERHLYPFHVALQVAAILAIIAISKNRQMLYGAPNKFRRK